MCANLTYPQTGDLPDAVLLGALVNARGQGAIINGFQLTADFAVPEVEVATGQAVIQTGPRDTTHPNITPAKTITETSVIVEINPQTVPLSSNALNSLFLDARLSVDDGAQVVANTTDTAPSAASIKIGEVNTSNQTTAEQLRLLADDGTLTFPTRGAIDRADANGRLPVGADVFDRANEEKFTVIS
jgi:hypothetical protein